MRVLNLLKAQKKKVISAIQYLFRKLGIGITSYVNLVNLQQKNSDRFIQDLEIIHVLCSSKCNLIMSLLGKSRSQLRQDLFVISEMEFKKGGYFVEFGAANGIDFSNTYLLETEFSWTGILAEPAKLWEKELKINRPNAVIETRLLWKDSNSSLVFNETCIPELSTIDVFSDKDGHRNLRSSGKKYELQSISLNDLLIKHQAPKHIDYLSIDTEGSEYEILKAINFNEFSIGIITVEHNNTPQKELIFALLSSYGYKIKHETISGGESWFVKN